MGMKSKCSEWSPSRVMDQAEGAHAHGFRHHVRRSATYRNMVHWSTLSTALLLGYTQSKNAEQVHWPNLQLRGEKSIFKNESMGGWESTKENLAPATGRLQTTTPGIAAGLQDSVWALPGWAARTPSSDHGWRWRNPWERASNILQNSQLWEWAAKNWEHVPPVPSPPKTRA